MKLLSCETCKFHDAGRCRRYAPGRGGQEVKSAPTVTPTREQVEYFEAITKYASRVVQGYTPDTGHRISMPVGALGAPYMPELPNPWPRVQADDWCGDWDA